MFRTSTAPRVSPLVATLLVASGVLSAPLLASADLLANGSFESGFDGWTVSGDVSIARGGWEGKQAGGQGEQMGGGRVGRWVGC